MKPSANNLDIGICKHGNSILISFSLARNMWLHWEKGMLYKQAQLNDVEQFIQFYGSNLNTLNAEKKDQKEFRISTLFFFISVNFFAPFYCVNFRLTLLFRRVIQRHKKNAQVSTKELTLNLRNKISIYSLQYAINFSWLF